jgi:hypothetical protein
MLGIIRVSIYRVNCTANTREDAIQALLYNLDEFYSVTRPLRFLKLTLLSWLLVAVVTQCKAQCHGGVSVRKDVIVRHECVFLIGLYLYY